MPKPTTQTHSDGTHRVSNSEEGNHHPLFSPVKPVSHKESGSFSSTSLFWGLGDPTPKLIFSSLKLHHRGPLLNDKQHSGAPTPDIFLASVGNPIRRKPPLLEDFAWERSSGSRALMRSIM